MPGEPQTAVHFKTAGIGADMKNSLQNDKLYYSTAVFQSLDATQIALLLSGYVVNVKQKQSNGQVIDKPVPISEVVEPQPIRYIVSGCLPSMRPGPPGP